VRTLYTYSAGSPRREFPRWRQTSSGFQSPPLPRSCRGAERGVALRSSETDRRQRCEAGSASTWLGSRVS
jgi:hypothetical protein